MRRDNFVAAIFYSAAIDRKKKTIYTKRNLNEGGDFIAGNFIKRREGRCENEQVRLNRILGKKIPTRLRGAKRFVQKRIRDFVKDTLLCAVDDFIDDSRTIDFENYRARDFQSELNKDMKMLREDYREMYKL